MQKGWIYLYKIYKKIYFDIVKFIWKIYTLILFYLNGVKHKRIKVLGKPVINVSLGGSFSIEDNFYFRSSKKYTDTGENRPCKFIVKKNAKLMIGSNVGISSTLIYCQERIVIGNNVRIGGGVMIFDTNFHSLNPTIRCSINDFKDVKTASILIEDNVFIGTASIIGKGVTIGENSIIAAGSVVVKSIPPNQVWGGNPARYISDVKL